ncbi:MAG: hypothetical protein HY303_04070 [Candidatus Wallbacteria bacterium]|nr:hypothetical protein [Candidatus Wallbacteria bacterium]
MDFDIRQPLLGSGGDVRGQLATRYREELMALFAESPEGRAILAEEGSIGHARLLVEYALDYEGVAPPDFTASTIEEVTFRVIPRKVMSEPEEAASIIREFRAFLQFLVRRFGLRSLEPCLDVLGESAIPGLERELANPRNFGMAKSFFREGIRRGFDLSTQEGLDHWAAVQNAESALGATVREPAAGRLRASDIELVDNADWDEGPKRAGIPQIDLDAVERARRKKKRKLEKASRRRNRRR